MYTATIRQIILVFLRFTNIYFQGINEDILKPYIYQGANITYMTLISESNANSANYHQVLIICMLQNRGGKVNLEKSAFHFLASPRAAINSELHECDMHFDFRVFTIFRQLVVRVLRLRRIALWQERASFDSLLSLAGLCHLGKE